MTNIKVKYTGRYPNLCSGELTVIINEKEYEFGECLYSTGEVLYDKDEEDYFSERGKWIFRDDFKPPDDFPLELLDEVLEVINEDIPWGCCGGCI